jgi:hypothetical protein
MARGKSLGNLFVHRQENNKMNILDYKDQELFLLAVMLGKAHEDALQCFFMLIIIATAITIYVIKRLQQVVRTVEKMRNLKENNK